MKKAFTLVLLFLFFRQAGAQAIKSLDHPLGYTLSATSTRLVKNGYLVAGRYDDGSQTVNYVSRYRPDGSLYWTRTESSGLLSGLMDLAENSRQELYMLFDDMAGDSIYALVKTDSAGHVLWTAGLSKKSFATYEAPKVAVNSADEVYVMSSTLEKALLYKLSDSGLLLWSKTITVDSASIKNPAFGLLTLQDGGIMYAGKAANDIYVQRISSEGSIVWTKRLFDDNHSYGHPKAIIALQDGNFLVTGFRGENTGDFSTGMFMLKINGSGTVLDYKFYYDSAAGNAFIPYAMYQLDNGDIRVMGGGGRATFADFDEDLGLQRYSQWAFIENLMVSAGCFHYHDHQLLLTGTDNASQYVLRNSFYAGDFCNQQDIQSMVTENLSVNNKHYDTEAVESTGPTAAYSAFTLQNAAPFTAGIVCGSSELALSAPQSPGPLQVSVYPNPVSRQEWIRLEAGSGETMQARLIHPSGQVMVQQAFSGSAQMDTGRLAAGLYYLQLAVNEKTVYTTKIIVY